jgi:hypothetical protein
VTTFLVPACFAITAWMPRILTWSPMGKSLTRQPSFEGCVPFPQSPRGRGIVLIEAAPGLRARPRSAQRPTGALLASAP